MVLRLCWKTPLWVLFLPETEGEANLASLMEIVHLLLMGLHV